MQLSRGTRILFGMLFGAWLGGIYAFFSQAFNWMVLPGIPLAAPGGSVEQYIITYILVGAALGFASAIPTHTAAGVVFGGLLGSFLSALVSVSSQWGDITVIRTMIVLLYTFLPLAVLLMPLAWMIRRGVDAQSVDPAQPAHRARPFLIPVLMTLLVVALASFSIYSGDVQRGFRITHEMVQAGLLANNGAELPAGLREVEGFRENAIPAYDMYWSDRAEEFFGPRPATGERSQFLIFTQFKNGYRIACVFAATTTVPNCTSQ